MKVSRTTEPGNKNYYALNDIFWTKKPNGDDPGMSYPKPGAIARTERGLPLMSEDFEDFEDFEDDEERRRGRFDDDR